MNNLGIKLYELRKQKNISQEELAEILGTSRQAISKWENGLGYPEIDKLIELGKFYNVSIDYLLNYELQSDNRWEFIKDILNKIDKKEFDVDINEFELWLKKYPNNYELNALLAKYYYFLCIYNKDKQLFEKAINQIKKAKKLIQNSNDKEKLISEYNETIVILLMNLEKYKEAKEFILSNNISNKEITLARVELGLGNKEETYKLMSEDYLNNVIKLLNNYHLQMEVLCEDHQLWKALDTVNTSIAFIDSISNEGGFLNYMKIVDLLVKAMIENSLNIDYHQTTNEIIKLNEIDNINQTTDSLKFYYNTKQTLYSDVEKLDDRIEEFLDTLTKRKFKYIDKFKEVYNYYLEVINND